MRAWLLLLLLPTVALATTFKGVNHKHWTHRYDHFFRKYAKRYFGPTVDWHWFKAQGIAESGLNPKAHSKAGAMGIMQIMPGTYKYIRKKNPRVQDLAQPRWNIAAAIFYDRHLFDKWANLVTTTRERLLFAFGCYNAGYTRVRRTYNQVRKKLGSVESWDQLDDYLPGQTRHYVRRIQRLMGVLL